MHHHKAERKKIFWECQTLQSVPTNCWKSQTDYCLCSPYGCWLDLVLSTEFFLREYPFFKGNVHFLSSHFGFHVETAESEMNHNVQKASFRQASWDHVNVMIDKYGYFSLKSCFRAQSYTGIEPALHSCADPAFLQMCRQVHLHQRVGRQTRASMRQCRQASVAKLPPPLVGWLILGGGFAIGQGPSVSNTCSKVSDGFFPALLGNTRGWICDLVHIKHEFCHWAMVPSLILDAVLRVVTSTWLEAQH